MPVVPALDRVLNAGSDLPLPTHPGPAPRPIRQGLAFDGVWFAYPGQTEPVLRGVSFTVHPGESLALVGHNGAGKTTIVKLLLRLFDPTAGRILLDGVDLEGGRVVEQGSHESLLARGGRYAELFEMQAGRYR